MQGQGLLDKILILKNFIEQCSGCRCVDFIFVSLPQLCTDNCSAEIMTSLNCRTGVTSPTPAGTQRHNTNKLSFLHLHFEYCSCSYDSVHCIKYCLNDVK